MTKIPRKKNPAEYYIICEGAYFNYGLKNYMGSYKARGGVLERSRWGFRGFLLPRRPL